MSSNGNALGNGKNGKNGKKRRRIIWGAIAVVVLGGDGVVSVVSNEAPAMMSALINAALESDISRARELHYKLLPLMNANFIESNPIPVKAALAMMGMIQETYRLPLVRMSEHNREKLSKIVEALGLLQTVHYESSRRD